MKLAIHFGRIRLLFVCLLIVCTLFPTKYSFAGSPSDSKNEAAIRGLIQEFVTAWNQDDAQALVVLFVQDGTLDTPKEAAAQSRSAIRKLLTQDRKELFQDSMLQKDIRKIQFRGTRQATVQGPYELTGVEPGIGLVKVSVKGEYTFLLEKQKDTWLINKCVIRRSGSEKK